MDCVYRAARTVPPNGRARRLRRRVCAYSPMKTANALASARKASWLWAVCAGSVQEDLGVTVIWAGWSDASQTRILRLLESVFHAGRTPIQRQARGPRKNACAIKDSREMNGGNVRHVNQAQCIMQIPACVSRAQQANIALAKCTTNHAPAICFHTKAPPSAAPVG
jgi:hypothetical protein